MQRRAVRTSVAFMFAVLAAASCGAGPSSRDASVVGLHTRVPARSPEGMLDLDRGVSLHAWFWGDDLSLEHARSAYGPADMDIITRGGFRNVRIPVQPEYIFSEERPEFVDPDRLAALEHAVETAMAHGLTVTVDMRPSIAPGNKPSSKTFDDRLRDDPDFRHRFAGSWMALAAELSRGRDPQHLVFEAMNEPEYDDPAVWTGVMNDLVDGIRRGAPDQWVIVDACRGGSFTCLLRSVPLEQPRLVYAVHYYDPMAFTSQGANWITPEFQELHDVPYPGERDAVEAVASRLPSPDVRDLARTVERWNRRRIEHDIAGVAHWSADHDVPVTINEFGVLKCFASRDDALLWTRDVRELAESYAIPWQRWDYSAGFGIFKDECGDRPSTRTRVDADVLHALGLRR